MLERKAPPTFPLVIEMRERAYWVTHWVEDSVDCLLHAKVPVVQVCTDPFADYPVCWRFAPAHCKEDGTEPSTSLLWHYLKSDIINSDSNEGPFTWLQCLDQVRHRDRVSREVIIEERRYDKAGQEHTPPANVSTRGEPFDTTSLDGLDVLEEVVPVPPSSLAASALAGSFGSSYGDDEASSDNPYAWAQRLRDIPDKVL